MKKLLVAGAAALIASLAIASAASADGSKPQQQNPSNGSSDRGGTTYHPVYTTPSGASVGVIVQPQPGAPQSAPANGYGVGGSIPLPGG